jgi:hypothetical protein
MISYGSTNFDDFKGSYVSRVSFPVTPNRWKIPRVGDTQRYTKSPIWKCNGLLHMSA